MAEDKAIRTVPFDGKTSSYDLWKEKLLSLCTIKGCAGVLIADQPDMPKDSDILDPTNDANKILLRAANTLAYSMLILSCSDHVSMQLVTSAKTSDLPNGDARKAWLNLQAVHEPKSRSDRFELEQKFNQCMLTQDNKNPDEWFAELETIKARLEKDFKVIITDESFISHIIFNLKPKFYQILLTMVKRELDNKQPITLINLKKDIRQIYAQKILIMRQERISTCH